MPLPTLDEVRDDIRAWCRGRPWPLYAPALLLYAWWLWAHLRDHEHWPLVGYLNFGVHELGHVLWSPFGKFLGVLGGSLTQCLLPFVGAFMFWRQREYFGLFFCPPWLATNLFYVATYASDARGQLNLPLLSIGGGEAVHDWAYLLETTGLLERDQRVAFLFRALAVLCMLAGIALNIWLLREMRRAQPGPKRGGGWG